jgi:hypothetical protein
LPQPTCLSAVRYGVSDYVYLLASLFQSWLSTSSLAVPVHDDVPTYYIALPTVPAYISLEVIDAIILCVLRLSFWVILLSGKVSNIRR